MNIQRKWLKRRLSAILLFNGYVADETLGSIARRIAVKPSQIVKLNSNENFFIPKKALVKLLKEVIEEHDPRIYPQDEEFKVKEAIGKYLGISPEHVVVGNGSDQLIGLITQLFLRSGDEAILVTPTFFMYRHSIGLQGARAIDVPLRRDFSLDVEQILAKATPKTRILFVCSPNNPTANQFEMEEILALIESFQGLVVVDEAYVEFAKYSVTHLIKDFENLIVLRTFSKAFGMASLRLGYAVSNTVITSALERVQLPYSVSAITLRMGLKLLENFNLVTVGIERLKQERERLIKRLNEIDEVKAFASQTNFVLFQTGRPSKDVHRLLLKQGILVKHLGRVLYFDNCLRTTVGLPNMNSRLLSALERACGG